MGNVVPSGGKGGVAPDLHVYLQEFPQLVFSAPLKQGKLLKSALCKSGEHGDAVIKVYRKPPPGALGPVDLEAQLRVIYERLVLIREHLTLYEVRMPASLVLLHTLNSTAFPTVLSLVVRRNRTSFPIKCSRTLRKALQASCCVSTFATI
jgi:hypothetical protein